MKRRPKIVLIGTGGTIASTASDPNTLTNYKVTETVNSLIAGVEGIDKFADIEYVQLFNVDSIDMTNVMLLTLAKRVDGILNRNDVDGVVITHGTDTIEETAYFLHLILKSSKPVVFVGSMRPGSALSSDGPLNLFNAVVVASVTETHGLGVLVLLNDRFFSARYVTKLHTTRVDSFGSFDNGSIGCVSDGKVYINQTISKLHTTKTEFNSDKVTSLPDVDIIYDYQSSSLSHYYASIDQNVAGIVIAACGNGSLTPNARSGTQIASKKGITCVRSTRVTDGIVTSGDIDGQFGTYAANSLNPQKARILLMLILSHKVKQDNIQSFFDKC